MRRDHNAAARAARRRGQVTKGSPNKGGRVRPFGSSRTTGRTIGVFAGSTSALAMEPAPATFADSDASAGGSPPVAHER